MLEVGGGEVGKERVEGRGRGGQRRGLSPFASSGPGWVGELGSGRLMEGEGVPSLLLVGGGCVAAASGWEEGGFEGAALGGCAWRGGEGEGGFGARLEGEGGRGGLGVVFSGSGYGWSLEEAISTFPLRSCFGRCLGRLWGGGGSFRSGYSWSLKRTTP